VITLRTGQKISIETGNQVWQCDHTKVDVLLVDSRGVLLGRPSFPAPRPGHLKLSLGIITGPRRQPSDGGIVERLYRTFSSELFATLPGYTGSNVIERPPEILRLKLLLPFGLGQYRLNH
jgi:hypothetical protein